MKNIIISDLKSFNKKKRLFKQAGKSSIHIISDFDRTLTKAFFNHSKIPSLISYLRKGQYLTKDYAQKAQALFDKYHPIELSTKISSEEKNKKMLEWWSSHYKLLAESGLDKPTIEKAINGMIQKKAVELRQGVKEFLKTVSDNKIPLIILSSGGLGNAALYFLEKQDSLYSNIHFIGNTLKFDKNGKFTGIKDNKIIHIFNKQEAETKNLPIYNEIKKRKNIILLGDSLGDLTMAKPSDYENIIKIGFFNYSEEENLEDFKKSFDIVITNDGSFEYINKILKQLLENKT